MHINELPPELLVRIFSNIDDFSVKIGMERVCSLWQQIVPLDWKATKTCPIPLEDPETLGLVLDRCGEWLEELWLQNMLIDEYLIIKQMARRMNCLKHLKFSKCGLNGHAVNSIIDLYGRQLYSFILDGDETEYHPIMHRMFENNSSKLEHLSLTLSRNYYDTLPTKLPSNLKSFSLRTSDKFNVDSSNLLEIAARDCKNLKIFHLKIHTLGPDLIGAIANIKSLVYLNLAVNSIEDQLTLQNLICHELPNLKALNIGGYCRKEMISNITRDRPDLVYLNVFTRHLFQIPESLNSLTLRINSGQFLPEMLFNQQNKSIQHLDIRELLLPCSEDFIEKLLGQFPDLKSIHCKLPPIYKDLKTFFDSIEKHLGRGRKIAIYFHQDGTRYRKYILPDDLPQIEAGWRAKKCKRKCENLVLRKLIKEAIDGGNEPTFLDEYWTE